MSLPARTQSDDSPRLLCKGLGSNIMVMENTVTVTVDVGDRGRFTIPDPAREVLPLDDDRTDVSLDIRVLAPAEAADNRAETKSDVDPRGRVTIKPAKIREQLGIKNREAIVEVTITVNSDDDSES